MGAYKSLQLPFEDQGDATRLPLLVSDSAHALGSHAPMPQNQGFSHFRIPFAVRFRAAQSIEKDIQITECSDDERVVNALAPAQFSLGHRRKVCMIDSVSNLADDPRN